MDAGGAAESESGSASGAPVGEVVDFRLPAEWKNLLKTACLAGARPAAAEPPEAGFRRDIGGQRLTAPGKSASPRRQLPGVCGREHVATLACAGAVGGERAGPRRHSLDQESWMATNSRRTRRGVGVAS